MCSWGLLFENRLEHFASLLGQNFIQTRASVTPESATRRECRASIRVYRVGRRRFIFKIGCSKDACIRHNGLRTSSQPFQNYSPDHGRICRKTASSEAPISGLIQGLVEGLVTVSGFRALACITKGYRSLCASARVTHFLGRGDGTVRPPEKLLPSICFKKLCAGRSRHVLISPPLQKHAAWARTSLRHAPP